MNRGGAVRLYLLALMAALTGGRAMAQQPWAYPAQTDHAGWLLFCEGMEKEVARQASTIDNRTLYERSINNAGALAAEFVVIAANAKISPLTDAGVNYWEAQGVGVAGKQLWDTAPLLDSQNHTGAQMRNMIIAMRLKQLDGCDGLADSSAAYRDQANKILKALAQTKGAPIKP